MRARTKRAIMIAISALFLISALSLSVYALRDAVLYFYTPSDIISKGLPEAGKRAKIGGQIATDSLDQLEDGRFIFDVIDSKNRLNVQYKGVLPDLFREGQGVIAEGAFDGRGLFIADKLLTKHDENYVPREISDTMKEMADSNVYDGGDQF